MLGFDEREISEEPRPHLVRPTAETKVIKVVDGRSTM
jgi:hypothetical protein